MRRLFVHVLALTALFTSLVMASAPSPAGARVDPPRVFPPTVEGLAGPLQFAVDGAGTFYVAEAFAGLLTKHTGTGPPTVLAEFPGEISGVALGDRGVYFTTTEYGGEFEPIASHLNVKTKGPAKVVADIFGFEVAMNPDAVNTYGLIGLPDDCAALVPDHIPLAYPGIVDSHAYGVAVRGGTAYVADAGANAIFEVAPNGAVSTLVVLPPQPLVVSAELADAFGLPPCVVGHVFNFEPVPTDVEVNDNGMLFVTTLPGGPEDPGFPPRGAVWQINPWTKEIRMIADGLAGATNLALGPNGTIYVAELFGGQISRIVGGRVVPHVALPLPGAVEFENGRLWSAYDVFGPGAIARVTR